MPKSSHNIGKTVLHLLRLWSPIVAIYGIILFLAIFQQGNAPAPSLTFDDKIQHFAFYGLLATLVYRAMPAQLKGRNLWLTAFILSAALGLLDEICQYNNPGRTGDLLDWTADCLGALSAILLYHGATPYRKLIEFSPIHWAISKTNI